MVQSEAARLLTQKKHKPEGLKQTLKSMQGPGVYIFWRDRKPIYVGDAGNLYNRLWGNHLRDTILRHGGSQFRVTLDERLKIKMGKPTTRWIYTECRVSFIQTPDHDTARAVEGLLIKTLRHEGLLNKHRPPTEHKTPGS